MPGREFKCSTCEFEFCSGWSHHRGGQFIVCGVCAAQFILGGGQLISGAFDGETFYLLKDTPNAEKQKNSLIDDIRVSVTLADPLNDESSDGICWLIFDEITCPSCGEATLVQFFKAGEPCPACHAGFLEDHGICMY